MKISPVKYCAMRVHAEGGGEWVTFRWTSADKVDKSSNNSTALEKWIQTKGNVSGDFVSKLIHWMETYESH